MPFSHGWLIDKEKELIGIHKCNQDKKQNEAKHHFETVKHFKFDLEEIRLKSTIIFLFKLVKLIIKLLFISVSMNYCYFLSFSQVIHKHKKNNCYALIKE